MKRQAEVAGSNPLGYLTLALLIVLAVGLQCQRYTEWVSNGTYYRSDGGSGAMTYAYGWPWIGYYSRVNWESGSGIPAFGPSLEKHVPIAGIEGWRTMSSRGSTLFVVPTIGNIAWWGALIYLLHRALAPLSSSPGKRRTRLQWSVRGLLVLQLLAAVAIGLGDRW